MNPPRRRAEDTSLFGKMTYLRERYFYIWGPACAIIVAAGFGFKTPAQTAENLQKQITSIVTKDSILALDRNSLERKVDILLRINCITLKIPAHDLQLLGLDCTKL